MTSWRLILRRRRDARRRAVHHRRAAKAVRALIAAAGAGSASRVAALLSADATLTVDAGPHTAADPFRLPGAGVTALELLSLLDRYPRRMLEPRDVNGVPAILVRYSDRVVAVISIEARASTISRIWVVVNPDKLAHWNRT